MSKTRPTARFSSALLLGLVVCFGPNVAARAGGPTADRAIDAAAANPLAPLSFEPLSLVVYKRQRALVVYEYGARKREYPIVLGAKPDGDKRFEGDLRTPEGLYHINGIRKHPRWRYFLSIDYPNARDIRTYRENVHKGFIPRLSGRTAGIGGAIGIHGTDKPGKQRAAEDWTRGCIAMYNSDIDELRSRVHVGTPVLILEGGGPIADHLATVIGSHRANGPADPR